MPYNTPPNIQEPMNFASSNPFGIIPDALSFQNFKYDRLQQQQQQPQQQQPISPPLFLVGAGAQRKLKP